MTYHNYGFLHPIRKRSRVERISEWWQSMYPASRWTFRILFAVVLLLVGSLVWADEYQSQVSADTEHYHIVGVEYADEQVFDTTDLIWLRDSAECTTKCNLSRMEVVLFYDPVQDQYSMTWVTETAFLRWLQTDFGPDVEIELYAMAEYTLAEIDPAGEMVPVGTLPRYRVLPLMYEIGVDNPVAYVNQHSLNDLAGMLAQWVYPYVLAREIEARRPGLYIVAELEQGEPV